MKNYLINFDIREMGEKIQDSKVVVELSAEPKTPRDFAVVEAAIYRMVAPRFVGQFITTHITSCKEHEAADFWG